MTHHMENDGDVTFKKKKKIYNEGLARITLPPAGQSNKTLT